MKNCNLNLAGQRTLAPLLSGAALWAINIQFENKKRTTYIQGKNDRKDMDLMMLIIELANNNTAYHQEAFIAR